VGCGRLARLGYVPALGVVPSLRLVAVADPDESRRSAFGVPSYRDAAELLAAEALDALVVASPVACHLDDARAAADAGVPVLVEKPPAADADEARRLAALDPQPWIGFNRRFDPELRRLRGTALDQAPLELRIELLHRRRSWRPFTVADDVLLDLAPHAFDLVRWLAGEDVTRVRTLTLTRDAVELEADTARARASVRLDREARYREEVTIVGRGRAVRGGLREAVASRLRGRPHPLVASLAAQLEAFAEAARSGDGDGLGTAADGVAVMRAVDAARRSAASRRAWVDA
jgi:predicted dehydrogenase